MDLAFIAARKRKKAITTAGSTALYRTQPHRTQPHRIVLSFNQGDGSLAEADKDDL